MASRSRRRPPVARVTNACEECKKRKVKCTGNNPCESCIARRISCVFKPNAKKILVSESYLHALENPSPAQIDRPSARASRQHALSPVLSPFSGVETPDGASRLEPITNPLVSSTSFYLQDNSGRYRFCGPSSTWAFSQRVFLIFKTAIPDYPSPNPPFHIDGSTWELNWDRASQGNATMLEGLPSLDDFLHLLHGIKFHSHQMLVLFDEDEFFPHLNEFYQNGMEKAKKSPLWFIQYLLLIALSKAYSAISSHSGSPPGHTFFERAMSLMPDFVGLHRQPNLAMQVLYLVALFLLTADMKDAAYAYASQSIRMSIIEGLHKEPPSELFGHQFACQCRDIWWSAYILDRQLSAVIGAPSSIQDAEISCTLPSAYRPTQNARFMTMHVKLARIVGQILDSVYTAEGRTRRYFIAAVQRILREMAQILQEIEDITANAQLAPFSAISTINCHLYLTYHQCIILATRPLFLHFLLHKLENYDHQNQQQESLVSSQLKPLLQVSLQSAKFSLRTLLMLHEETASQPLFPFGLDNLFSSAFVVVIAHFIDPSLVPDMHNYLSNVNRIFIDLAGKGNATAQLRHRELELLQKMIEEITRRDRRCTDGVAAPTSEISSSIPILGPPNSTDEWAGTMEDINFSHTDILTLAQQLDILSGSDWDMNFEREDDNFWI